MSAVEVVMRSMVKTLHQGESFNACGVPLPPWLVKKLKGMVLLETDPASGLALYVDGLQDEKDAVRDAKFHR